MPEAPETAPTTPVILRALRTLLRPLVRLLLARQIPYPALAALLKEVYVEVADSDFRLPDKRQTDSRVSLLTGIHRKDVSRLRAQPPGADAVPRTVSLGAQIVARWLALDACLDADGRPLPLPRQTRESAGESFESLVRSVSKDIRPRAVLDEWLRLGIAHLDSEDRVVLNTEAFVPEQGFEEKAYYFGRNLRDHIAAGAHNLQGASPPFLDRSVYYARLSPESAREVAQLAERLGMDALRAVNKRALLLQERDAGGAGSGDVRQRINFGIWFYGEDQATAESGPEAAPGPVPDGADASREPGDG